MSEQAILFNILCVFLCLFRLPAGAQTDQKLHEGRLYGENRPKGLFLSLDPTRSLD